MLLGKQDPFREKQRELACHSLKANPVKTEGSVHPLPVIPQWEFPPCPDRAGILALLADIGVYLPFKPELCMAVSQHIRHWRNQRRHWTFRPSTPSLAVQDCSLKAYF